MKKNLENEIEELKKEIRALKKETPKKIQQKKKIGCFTKLAFGIMTGSFAFGLGLVITPLIFKSEPGEPNIFPYITGGIGAAICLFISAFAIKSKDDLR